MGKKITKLSGIGTEIAEVAVKKLGLEGIEALSKETAKQVFKSLAEKIGLGAGKILQKACGEHANKVLQIITEKLGKGALTEASKEGSTVIAKQIGTELEKEGVKIAPEVIEKALISEKSTKLLAELAEQLEKGTAKEFSEKLSTQEIQALNSTLGEAIKTGVGTEAKQAFVTLLTNSPKFLSEAIFKQTLSTAFAGLKVFFKATLDPIGLLASKLTRFPTAQSWLLERGVTRFAAGVFATTTTFGYLSNLFKQTNFTNLEGVVSSIISNLRSYDFKDSDWTKLVDTFETRLKAGLQSYEQAKTINLTANDDINAAKDKTNNFIKATATGDEELKRTFQAIASPQFKNAFDIFNQKNNQKNSSTVGTRADQFVGVVEKITPVDIKNITIVQDAANQGLQMISTYNINTDAILANIDKSISKDMATLQGQTTHPDQNKVSYYNRYILTNFIKVAKMINKVK